MTCEPCPLDLADCWARRRPAPRVCELVRAELDAIRSGRPPASDYRGLVRAWTAAPPAAPEAAGAIAWDPAIARAAETCPHRRDGPADHACGCRGALCGEGGRRAGERVGILECYRCREAEPAAASGQWARPRAGDAAAIAQGRATGPAER